MAYYTTYDWSSGTNLDIDSTLNGSDTQIIEITSSMSGGNATLTLPSVEATGSGVDLGWFIQVVDTGGFIGEGSTITIVPNSNDTFYTYKVNGSTSGFNWTSGNTAVVITYLNYGVWYVSSSFGATIKNAANNRILTSYDSDGIYAYAEASLTYDGDMALAGGNNNTGTASIKWVQSANANSSGTEMIHQSSTIPGSGSTNFDIAFTPNDRNMLGVTCDVALFDENASTGYETYYSRISWAATYNDDASGNTVPSASTEYIFKDTIIATFTLTPTTVNTDSKLRLNIANASANTYEAQVFWQINNASYDIP